MNPISLDLAAIETAKSVMRAQMRQARRAFIREHPEADWEAGDRGADLVAWLGFTTGWPPTRQGFPRPWRGLWK
jgi:hypothetical protein